MGDELAVAWKESTWRFALLFILTTAPGGSAAILTSQGKLRPQEVEGGDEGPVV